MDAYLKKLRYRKWKRYIIVAIAALVYFWIMYLTVMNAIGTT